MKILFQKISRLATLARNDSFKDCHVVPCPPRNYEMILPCLMMSLTFQTTSPKTPSSPP